MNPALLLLKDKPTSISKLHHYQRPSYHQSTNTQKYHQVRVDVTSPYVISLKPKEHIVIRNMTKADLKMVMGWAAKEGWNPGRYEVEPLYALDPYGYKLLEVDDEPVASLACVRHSTNFAFLGLYIVREEFRGKGYGKMLWDIALAGLRGYRTIGLNGVMDQVDNYQRSGFYPERENTRWKGQISEFNKNSKPLINTNFTLQKDFSTFQLINYDKKIFSTPRAAFLSKWLTMPESHALAAIEGGKLRGYGVISLTENGYKIAPLFADNEIIAEKIYLALCRNVDNHSTVHIDTSDNNPSAITLAKRLSLEPAFNTLRMYKGEPPSINHSKVFGLTSLEIG